MNMYVEYKYLEQIKFKKIYHYHHIVNAIWSSDFYFYHLVHDLIHSFGWQFPGKLK